MLSLYVHIPFCRTKCRYCGFFSTVYDRDKAESFINGLRSELASHAEMLMETEVSSLYLGGGTPSVLAPGQLDEVLRILRASVNLVKGGETTVEANPESLSRSMLEVLKSRGTSRLSIGVQSFSDNILRWLGRPHDAGQARDALKLVNAGRFCALSIDLIYGIPGLSREAWIDTVGEALRNAPEHLSLYSLSVDPGSRLEAEGSAAQGTLPDDELVARQYQDAVDMLRSAGFYRYELSNFSRPGQECRHNLHYWDRGEYLGIGPGAWSFIGGRRTMNSPDLDRYLLGREQGGSSVSFSETPDEDQARTETLALGLRRASGIDLREFARRHGETEAGLLRDRVRSLSWTGLYELYEQGLRLTDRGMLLANDAVSRIIS